MRRFLKIPRLLLNGRRLMNAVYYQMAGRGKISENRVHIRAAVEWLMKALETGGGGFSRRYCLYEGWDKPYIETTGYIIPTMIAAGRYLNDEAAVEGGKRAAYWLLGVQKDNGSFFDADTGREQVFDTGQVLSGLIAAFREWGDRKFLDAAVRAGDWLREVNEEDGSWVRYSYNGVRHTYYVKVAASLLELARITEENRYHETAMKNIHWTMDCQSDDGFFRHMEFDKGEYPFLHTIVYVIEGLLDAYVMVNDKKILEAVEKCIDALKLLNRDRELLLCSQYGENWEPVNRQRCITGLAQWAGVAMKVYDLTGDEDLLQQSVKTMYYLKSKQYLKPDPDLYGCLPGSVPLWGKYMGLCYPNWGVKYSIDALLAYEKYRVPLWREQEIWVSESFSFSDTVVSEEIGSHDRQYLMLMEKEIENDKTLTVLDIGCGKGKFIRYFRERFPHWTVTGVDPFFYDGRDIGKGSVYSLPVPDGHADVVMLIEVMQHIEYLKKAMSELSRVVKPGGVIVIGDRDRLSIIGLLKPLLETAGFWMYPWDSPFRERWRSVGEWENILGDDWRITSSQSFGSPENRIPLSNRFYLLTARKQEL